MKRRRIVAVVLVALGVAVGTVRYEDGSPVEHMVSVPGYPEHMALDEQTGRLFVTLAPTSMGSLTESLGVLDSSNGTLLRTLQTPLRAAGEGCCDLPVTVDPETNRVFVSSTGDPRLLMLDAHHGDVQAIVSNDSPIPDGLLLSRNHRRVMIVRTQAPFSGVRVLDASSGRVARSVACPGAGNIFTQLGIGAGSGVVEYPPLERLFIGSNIYPLVGSGVCVIDPLRGRALPRVRIGSGDTLIDALALDDRTARVFVASHRDIGSEPQVGAGSVTMLDVRTGHVLRTTRVGQYPFQMAVDANASHVFVLNTGGYQGPASVSILDARTGRMLHTVPIAPTPSSLAIDARTGQLAVTYQNGSMDWLDPWNGRTLLHATGSTQPLLLGTDTQTDRTFTTTFSDGRVLPASSNIQVRATHTGRILRAIAVSGAVGPMAIDTKRHRAFVAVAGCTEPVHDALGWLPAWLRGRLPWLSAPPAPSHGNGCVLVLDTAR